jgi:hypothetical protein
MALHCPGHATGDKDYRLISPILGSAKARPPRSSHGGFPRHRPRASGAGAPRSAARPRAPA